MAAGCQAYSIAESKSWRTHAVYYGHKTHSSVLQEVKMQQKLAFERHLEEKQKEHTQLLLMNNSRKENMLNSVRQVRHMLNHTTVRQV